MQGVSAGKRAFDVALACAAGIVALPVLGLAMLAVRLCSPEAPVLFRQERIGYGGRPFTMCKLRTMTDERDAAGSLLPGEQRLKPWGKILRKLSIDELTQIAHILKGEMSWIGPRPLLPEEMAVMTPGEQAERQSVLPGISGWEAVNEAKSDDRRAMAEYDLYYVRHQSWRLDAEIFFRTVAILCCGHRADEAHRAPKLDKKQPVAGC